VYKIFFFVIFVIFVSSWFRLRAVP